MRLLLLRYTCRTGLTPQRSTTNVITWLRISSFKELQTPLGDTETLRSRFPSLKETTFSRTVNKDMFLAGFAADHGKEHPSWEAAELACANDPCTNGITKEKAAGQTAAGGKSFYTCRASERLRTSLVGESSWLRTLKADVRGKVDCRNYTTDADDEAADTAFSRRARSGVLIKPDMYTYGSDHGFHHASLEKAEEACAEDIKTKGITEEREGVFTCRAGFTLIDPKNGSRSWVRTRKASSGTPGKLGRTRQTRADHAQTARAASKTARAGHAPPAESLATSPAASGPYFSKKLRKGFILQGFGADNGKNYSSLEAAQVACANDPCTNGITKSKLGGGSSAGGKSFYTCRSGKRLIKSLREESSWLRTRSADVRGVVDCGRNSDTARP